MFLNYRMRRKEQPLEAQGFPAKENNPPSDYLKGLVYTVRAVGMLAIFTMGAMALLGRGTLSPVVMGSITASASAACIFTNSGKKFSLSSATMFAFATSFGMGISMTQGLINPAVFGYATLGVHTVNVICLGIASRGCQKKKEVEHPYHPDSISDASHHHIFHAPLPQGNPYPYNPSAAQQQ